MNITTWNMHHNANFGKLDTLARVSQVICLQEVHGDIIDAWKLKKEGKYFSGKRKIGTASGIWDILYWNNGRTKNRTMGLAILWKNGKGGLKFLNGGVYTFNKHLGPPSETRGLPWIIAEDKLTPKIRIYSYHSVSSGDNARHVAHVNNLMISLMPYPNEVTFGDFNMRAHFYKLQIKKLPKEYGLSLVASPLGKPSRPKSGKNLDYAVFKNGLKVKFNKRIPITDSDHMPMNFSVVKK